MQTSHIFTVNQCLCLLLPHVLLPPLLHRKQLKLYLPEGVIASKKKRPCPEQPRGNIVADEGVGSSKVAGSKRLSSPTLQTNSLAKRSVSSGSGQLSPNGSSDVDTVSSLGVDSGVGRSLSSFPSDASFDVSEARTHCLHCGARRGELCPDACVLKEFL